METENNDILATEVGVSVPSTTLCSLLIHRAYKDGKQKCGEATGLPVSENRRSPTASALGYLTKEDKNDTVYLLVEKGLKIRELDALYLLNYLHYGYSSYFSAEEAEEGRKNGDAYDEPGKTRVVGFKITPFLPKVKKAKRKPISK